jgi:hypothetical protein
LGLLDGGVDLGETRDGGVEERCWFLGESWQAEIANCKLQNANCNLLNSAARTASAGVWLRRAKARFVRIKFERRAQTGNPCQTKSWRTLRAKAPRRALGRPRNLSRSAAGNYEKSALKMRRIIEVGGVEGQLRVGPASVNAISLQPTSCNCTFAAGIASGHH